MRWIGRAALVVVSVAAAVVVSGEPAIAGPVSVPTDQLIAVSVGSPADTSGTLTAYQRRGDGSWSVVAGPTPAMLGSQGIGEPSETSTRTPAGTFGLDQAFGRQPNPGTKMPYFQAGVDDWWDGNVLSPTYNSHVHRAAGPGGDSENLYAAGPVYDYAVNIASNPLRIPGQGSAIFLHVTENKPTAGCVTIDRGQMVQILRWLDPAQHPMIAIGVGRVRP